MASPSTESTPRERLSRMLTLLKRTRMFWRSSLAIAAVGLAISLVLALNARRAFRSETTILFRDPIQTKDGESAAQRAASLGPKLKDLLYARPRLEQVIREYDLFPERTQKSMLDAVEEMKSAIAFRARSGDSFVISFTYDDPGMAQQVTARLTSLMVAEYNRQNVNTATLTRDFLERELEEANVKIDEASRALATFLARHPQFQWGLNDSPYAPTPVGAAPGGRAAPPPRSTAEPAAPQDRTLALLQRELAQVEAELAPGAPRPLPTASAAPGPAAASPLLEAQKQREAAAAALAAAQAVLAERLTTVTPLHPDAISAQVKVDAARQQLAAAEAALNLARAGGAPADRAARVPEAPLDPGKRAELERRRDQLRRQIEGRRAELALGGSAPPAPPASSAGRKAPDVIDLETEWHRLRLELDRARDQLHLVQTNAQTAKLRANEVMKQSQEEMQVLEPAYRPIRPDRGRGRVFFAGATLALFFALGHAAARVLLNDTLLDEGDVVALGGPPMLVSLPVLPAPEARETSPSIVPVSPRAPPQEIRICPPTPRPPAAALAVRQEAAVIEAELEDPEVEVLRPEVDPETDGALARMRGASAAALAALRILRHRLEQRRGEGSFVVAVVSPGLGEGKTLLAAELALTLSESERARVILVEGNLGRPAIARTFGLRLGQGVSFSAQVRQRMNGLARPWGVVRLGASLAALVEPGPEAVYPAALHSTHFEAAIAALRRSYAYVVIDGPAILGSGDANVIEGVSDGVVIVARAASTRGGELSRAVQQLGERRILGVVLNGVA